jgi:N-glycosylase/DNA lyase
MNIRLDIDLEHTLTCGQAFRWRWSGSAWSGIVDARSVVLRQVEGGVEAQGMDRQELSRYLRSDDDLGAIYADICRDPVVRACVGRLRGLRLLRQDPWECAASFILATNASIKRISGMVEAVCRTFGRPLGDGAYAFPTPGEILDRREDAAGCGLGYRCHRFVEFAGRAEEGCLDGLDELPYDECVRRLMALPGIGDKVADCVALFSLDHLEAFPVDVRIERILRGEYSMTGTQKKLGDSARARFGPFAGYAQQYLYHGLSGLPSSRGRRTPAP